MKILWHFNSHRHFFEYFFSSQFFNRTKFIKQHTDVLVTCNKESMDLDALRKMCVYESNVDIIRTTNPKNGVHTGQLVSLNETFHRFSEYDYVIHTTPDVYLVKEDRIVELLHEELGNNHHMIVDYHPYHPQTKGVQYCTDFFIFKPKLIKNFFGEKFEPTVDCHCIENFLYKALHDFEIPHRTICRGISSLRWQIDDYGLIHNHNLDIIKNILYFNEAPDQATAFSHNWIKTP